MVAEVHTVVIVLGVLNVKSCQLRWPKYQCVDARWSSSWCTIDQLNMTSAEQMHFISSLFLCMLVRMQLGSSYLMQLAAYMQAVSTTGCMLSAPLLHMFPRLLAPRPSHRLHT